MSYSFQPATLEGVGLFIAIAAPSRAGKTKSALRLARGIAGSSGKIAAIDTEGKRMSHYANEFKFDVFNMPPPFNGSRFLEAARGAQTEGYAVVVIDSFSLEWSGTGGVLAEHARLWASVNYDAKKSDMMWNRVKGPGSEHKLMMDGFLQLTIPVIFCLRSKFVADHLGGGLKIDQDKTFMFDWTVGLTLHPETPGMPRYDMVDAKKKPLWKVQDQHMHLFPTGQLIGEDAGAGLQAWRNSEAARSMGSHAVAEERQKTPAEWMAELNDDLAAAPDNDTVNSIAMRWDVIEALEKAPVAVRTKINTMVKAAIDRTSESVPTYASRASDVSPASRQAAGAA